MSDLLVFDSPVVDGVALDRSGRVRVDLDFVDLRRDDVLEIGDTIHGRQKFTQAIPLLQPDPALMLGEMIEKTIQEAAKDGVRLGLVDSDWRKLDSGDFELEVVWVVAGIDDGPEGVRFLTAAAPLVWVGAVAATILAGIFIFNLRPVTEFTAEVVRGLEAVPDALVAGTGLAIAVVGGILLFWLLPRRT